MKRFFSLWCLIGCLGFSCGGEPRPDEPRQPELPPIEKIYSPPVIPYIPPATAYDFDNHYNSVLENTKIDSSAAKELQPPENIDVDFRALDKDWGFLRFPSNGILYWPEAPVEIMADGGFETDLSPDLSLFYLEGAWHAFGLNISGRFSGDKLEAKVAQKVYMGADLKNMYLYAAIESKLSGVKRFARYSGGASAIIGEYGAETTRYKNTCGGIQTFPSDGHEFSYLIKAIKNNVNSVDLEIFWTIFKNLRLDFLGNIKGEWLDGETSYSFKGRISDKIILDIIINRGESNCAEEYRIEGVRRFAENRGKDATIDGIHTTRLIVKKNTCPFPVDSAVFFSDVIKTGSNRAEIVVKGLYLAAELDAAGRFQKSFEDTYYNTLESVDVIVSPQKLSVEYKIFYQEQNCEVIVLMDGVKTYKHL